MRRNQPESKRALAPSTSACRAIIDSVKPTTFQCSCCGHTLDGPPLSWHLNAPDAWTGLSALDRRFGGNTIDSDLCIIHQKDYFIHGLIEIPVLDGEGPFAWGVWVSLSKDNFNRSCDLWDDPARVNEPAYFGWLSNSLPGYPETLNLKTAVHNRAVGMRPYIELEPTEHPLALEQANGITTARVREIAERMHHHNGSLPNTGKK